MPQPIRIFTTTGVTDRRTPLNRWTERHPFLAAIVLLLMVAALVVMLSGVALSLPLADKGAPAKITASPTRMLPPTTP
jgi:hypothetical protein